MNDILHCAVAGRHPDQKLQQSINLRSRRNWFVEGWRKRMFRDNVLTSWTFYIIDLLEKATS